MTLDEINVICRDYKKLKQSHGSEICIQLFTVHAMKWRGPIYKPQFVVAEKTDRFMKLLSNHNVIAVRIVLYSAATDHYLNFLGGNNYLYITSDPMMIHTVIFEEAKALIYMDMI